MSSRVPIRAGRLAAAVLFLQLAACVPWTVRPLDEGKNENGQATLNPAAYVDSIWSSKLVPAVLNAAVDARTLLDALAASPEEARGRFGRQQANGPWYFIVKGEGRVLSVDTRSRAGFLLVDVAPFDARADVSIQIGPVLRGASLRDAPGIVRFTDFVNQLQFADVGNELNDRVLKNVLALVRALPLKGRTISFAGTASPGETATPPIRDLVPVRLAVETRP